MGEGEEALRGGGGRRLGEGDAEGGGGPGLGLWYIKVR
jgi:hypothetical protein